ncbi:FecR family protein [Polaromonas sp.]|uniref:FecR family protein n=1 Tax=Polaromonas sp. TaxID=1869339 RepID=UPI0032646BC2
MKHDFQLKNTVLLMALAAAYPLQAHALAGIAQFTAGEVSVRQSDGRTIALAKGSNIDSGQAIVTGSNGRAQVKFTDGGLISLQPNTEFKIANYVDQNDAKEDRFLVDLLRGSMRAITGLIGKRNRDNYKLTTTTATIGIRGSGFKVGYNPDGSLSISSELDKIEVCNQSGCIGLVAGESVKVVDSTTPPVRTSEQAKVGTPTTQEQEDPTAVGDQVGPTGASSAIGSTTTTLPVMRTFTNIKVNAAGSNGTTAYKVSTAAGATTVFSDNKLLKLDDVNGAEGKWGETGTPQPEANFKSVGNVTDANFIGWGMWTTGQRDYLGTVLLNHVHYIAGRPTSAPEISAMFNPIPYNLTYNMVGSTAPTYDGAIGTLNGASLVLTFGSAAYDFSATINTSFANFTDSATSLTGSSFTGVNGYIKGDLIGSGAAFAGLTYSKPLTNGPVTGAIVFTKP